MYAVVQGTKVFTLLPPCDTFRMHLQKYPVAQYTPDQEGRLVPRLTQPLQEVVWCPINPYPEGALHRHPEYRAGRVRGVPLSSFVEPWHSVEVWGDIDRWLLW
jgi:hypothetical protein